MQSRFTPLYFLSSIALSTVLFGCGGSNSDKPQIPTPNVAPTVDAGNDISADELTVVTLSSTANDTDGTISSYLWEQTAGTTVTLNVSNAASATFTAPDINADETLTFSITVTDEDGATASDTVNVNLLRVNQAPIVDAGNPITANEQTLVTLNATAQDPDGTITSYLWEQTTGEDVMLDANDRATITFTSGDINSNTILEFTVTVSDNDGETASDTLIVNLNRVNQVPVAIAGSDQTVIVDTEIMLSGSLSTDPDGDSLTYTWSLSGPNGSSAALTSSDVVDTTFSPDTVGEYLVSLVVSDGEADSEPDTVTITVTSPQPSVNADIRGTVLSFDSNDVAIQSSVDEIDIMVTLLDDNNNVVATDIPEAIFNQAQPNELRFDTELTGSGASMVAITVSRSGFTSFSRRLDILEVNRIEAKLTQIPQEEVSMSSSQSISGTIVTGFNVDMMSNVDAGGISIGIPSSLLPNDTTSLMVAVETFDPNNPDDAELFPGEYADSEGQPLVSVAFNYAEIMTQSGENIVEAIERKRNTRTKYMTVSERKNAVNEEEPVVINRNIPASSCGILNSLGDSAPSTEGFQVPVYTYSPSTGLWELLGQGSVYDGSGNLQAADKSDFDCQSVSYILEILVTNEIFLSDWWNLDYPLVFNEPVRLCANFEVQNLEQETLANIYGLVSDRDTSVDFNSEYFSTDENGRASVEVVRISQSDDVSAVVQVFSTVELGSQSSDLTLSTDCDNPPLQIVTVDRPPLCSVAGRSVFEDGLPAVDNLIYGVGFNNVSVTYDFTYVDENGDYELDIACNTDVTVYDYFTTLLDYIDDDIDNSDLHTFEINVDNTVNFDELSDDGDRVTLPAFEVDPLEPFAQVGYASSINTLFITTLAPEAYFPMQGQILMQNENGSETFDTVNLTIELVDGQVDNALWFFTSTSSRVADYTLHPNATHVVIRLTDASGEVYELPRSELIIQGSE
ncbi:PKD domain-containing protein [Glaciecola sp. 1036]|uniref:PKD domain-containing protein n=1 Tax=Alteromonadaceae TaxID=72275 RepID=UPI003CFC7535